ncbi:MAG TPA: hypothetical protein VGA94_01860 [Thermodesulfobacteriota bacterium]|jgi:REP element-mobilizing transposase RayT
MKYDPEKHHRDSIRLKEFDYGQAGAYFVTICTKDRECLFGEIEDGKMRLNECGEIVPQTWKWLAEPYPYVLLGEWMVMPNHLDGIITIVDESHRCRAVREPPYNGCSIKSEAIGKTCWCI